MHRLRIDSMPGVTRLARFVQQHFFSDLFDDGDLIRFKNGEVILGVPRSYFRGPPYLFRNYEQVTAERMRAVLRPGMTAVDVGAHVGYHTLLMSKLVGAQGRVFAFEPSEENLVLLRHNIDLNRASNVTVFPLAVGCQSRKRTFNIATEVWRNSFYASPQVEVIRQVDVSEVRLDEVITGPVDLVKIDVEGAEIEVLDGMGGLLDSPALSLIAEWNPACLRSAGRGSMDLPIYLESRGFNVVVLDDEMRTRCSVGEIAHFLQEDRLSSTWYANLFAQRLPGPIK
jgi:FkbM family methyltransferase